MTHDTSGQGEETPSYTPRSPGSVSSIWSTATGAAHAGGLGQGFKISDKLQIIKPMEGSMTLRHWKHLANPHLGGLFEQRDGIQMKGEGKQQDPTMAETYSISDLEED
ncbi:trafficking kinesin-binding protein 1-like, partial [Plakobranchus ocellatus]